MTPSIRQTLVEYMELVAIGKEARWDHHSYCYLNFQMSVKNAVEIGDSFKSLPAAFSSKAELLRWASVNHQTVDTIGLPADHAVITHGDFNGAFGLQGASFIWVRATSPRYREAVLVWLQQLRSDRDLRLVQKRAAEVYQQVASSLENGLIRKRMKPVLRAAQVKELNILSRRCLMASSTAQKAQRDIRLLEALDTTLDADHVINKKSLTNMPDAWVMLAPVIASSNRGFGRVVEKYATRFAPLVGEIGLDAVTAFKLFASTIPTRATLAQHMDRFARQFIAKQRGLDLELQSVSKALGSFVIKTSKSFKR